MPTRIGLMGLGRIGRNLFRLLHDRKDFEIAAVSDIADPTALAYLLQFDTVQGRFPAKVELTDGKLSVGGNQVPLLAAAKGGDVDWSAHGVDVVIEATGRPRSRAELSAHLDRGAKRVLLCSPASDAPDITFVPGANDGELSAEHRIVHNGSATVHAAAPLLKVLSERFGITRAFVTTTHAYTDQQRLADVPAVDGRSGRAAAENIVPQKTNSADLLSRVLPWLAGKLTGLALNVPVANGSAVDLVCWHDKPVTVEAINTAVQEATSGVLKGILDYERAPIVSSDILGSAASGIFDSLSTMVLKENVSKTLVWFDNSWGYSNRAVDLLDRFQQLDKEAAR